MPTLPGYPAGWAWGRNIARAHDGDLTLRNGAQGGGIWRWCWNCPAKGEQGRPESHSCSEKLGTDIHYGNNVTVTLLTPVPTRSVFCGEMTRLKAA